MRVFIGGLIEGILDFLTDVWLLRKKRSLNGRRPENSWKKDAADVAYLDWWVTLVATGLALLGFVVMFYMLGFSFGVSFFGTVVPAGLYCVYRWIKLTKD